MEVDADGSLLYRESQTNSNGKSFSFRVVCLSMAHLPWISSFVLDIMAYILSCTACFPL